MVYHKFAYKIIFSYTLSDWFNKLLSLPLSQSAGSFHLTELK